MRTSQADLVRTSQRLNAVRPVSPEGLHSGESALSPERWVSPGGRDVSEPRKAGQGVEAGAAREVEWEGGGGRGAQEERGEREEGQEGRGEVETVRRRRQRGGGDSEAAETGEMVETVRGSEAEV